MTLNAEHVRLAEDERREKIGSVGVRISRNASGERCAKITLPTEIAGIILPHDHARSRTYRWGEDGLLGLCDREGRLCFALCLWNERDPILKERLYGLTNGEGNHGEDVKEVYFYLDSTPTHSFMRALYKYPQREFPYAQLLQGNRERSRHDSEFEITDTDVFDDNRYFDVFVEYAKFAPDDVLMRVQIVNRSEQAARLHLLPTLWFRNTWSWGRDGDGYTNAPPRITRRDDSSLVTEHENIESFVFAIEPQSEKQANTGASIEGFGGATKFLFTNNETNLRKLYEAENQTPFVKDAFHEYIVGGNLDAVNPAEQGTKAAAHYRLEVAAKAEITLRFRLCAESETPDDMFGREFDEVFDARKRDADEFYNDLLPSRMNDEEKLVARQAYAGLLWSKQFYHFIVKDWLEGDPNQPPPPPSRKAGRNSEWQHLFSRDVLSMPDKWEYPWFAAWDTAFHLVGFAQLDPRFAKDQLLLFMREWYMHPNGALPAYEFNFNDANPPVHAWACWRVYKLARNREGKRDRVFLERAFQKLLINFTWWVNRKDVEGNNIFAGGFLGLDNIGVFDRSQPLPNGGSLEQADGTAWMAFYCATMMQMALELASESPAYEDLASKFFEHFIAIVDAMNAIGGSGLWDDEDGFYYDEMLINKQATPLRIRSMVGLIPLFAVENLEQDKIDSLPGFKKRFDWFVNNRPDLAQHILCDNDENDATKCARRLLAIPSRERLTRVLRYMLDEREFLSDYGIRSLSRAHLEQPFVLHQDGREWCVAYEAGESQSSVFGGNSNWRGPVWFPTNYLLIEALERYHHFYGDSLQVECPSASGRLMNLQQVADELTTRLSSIFLTEKDGAAAAWQGADKRFAFDEHWRKLYLFHEYFDGDTGKGLGASHQTGWTALTARLIEDLAYTRAAANNNNQRQQAASATVTTTTATTIANANDDKQSVEV